MTKDTNATKDTRSSDINITLDELKKLQFDAKSDGNLRAVDYYSCLINGYNTGGEYYNKNDVINDAPKKLEDSNIILPDVRLDGSNPNCLRPFCLQLATEGKKPSEIHWACHVFNESGKIKPQISEEDMDTKVLQLCKTTARKVEQERIEREANPEYADLYYWKIIARGDGFEYKLVLKHIEIVEWLHKKFHTVSFDDELYTYEDGVYVPNSNICENELRVFLTEIKMEGMHLGTIREIVGRLKIYEPYREYPFNKTENMLPVSNGVVFFDFENYTVKLVPYSHEHLFTIKLPVVFNPNADGSKFKENVLGKYVDEEKLPVLYMAPAMAILQLIKHRVFKKSLICEGETNSGKTTFLEWLLAIFSLKYCSSISLHEISEDRFAFAQLENKILNSYDELSDMRLDEIEKFKKLTGRQDHKIEKKGKDGYDTIITAFHIFATNRPPTTSEKILYDNAFWGRWFYLHFDCVFDVDMKFKDKWFTEENLSGSFNDIIAMVLQIERDGKLPVVQDQSTVKEEWNNHAEPFLTFVMENMYDSSSETYFDKDHLLKSFRDWCFKEDNNISPRTVPTTTTGLTEKIFRFGFKTKQEGKRTKTQDNRKWVYASNMTWRDNSPYKPKESPLTTNKKIS